jgi:dihydroneopterin aldolase
MMHIFLQNLKWIGEHGVTEPEKNWGTTFIINATLQIEEKSRYDGLDQTADYQSVHEIIKREFSIRESLLENLVSRIYDRLVESFPSILHVDISIAKEDPPIKGFSGRVGVHLKKAVR